MPVSRFCCDGKVSLIFTASMAGGLLNTSKNLEWIRSQYNNQGLARNLEVFSCIDRQFVTPGFRRERGGVIAVPFGLVLRRVYVAQELLKYPTKREAFAIILDHERQHVDKWNEVMESTLQAMGRVLESQITGEPTADRIAPILTQFWPRVNDGIYGSEDDWDRAEWRGIHRDLENLDIPPVIDMS